MLIDFNTPKEGNEPKRLDRQEPDPAGVAAGESDPGSVGPASDPIDLASEKPGWLFALAAVGLLFGFSSLVLSLITLQNLPKPEPVVIHCHPDLLKKIENQAAVLSEIAESAKVRK